MSDFVPAVRQIMEQRLFDKLVLRQNKIHAIVQSCSEQPIPFGFMIHHTSVSAYNTSYIDRQSIRSFINERWIGPFLPSNTSGKTQQSISFDKCKYLGENWIDQHCYEITGRCFYALHITASKSHLNAYCDGIIGISDTQKEIVLKHCLSYFVDKVLRAKVVYRNGDRQPTSKPLIPYKTLRNSDDILKAFGSLHNALDLTNIHKRKKIDSKVFFDKLLNIADELKGEHLKEMKHWNNNQNVHQNISNNNNKYMLDTADNEVLDWVKYSMNLIDKMSTVQTLSTENANILKMVQQVFINHNYSFSSQSSAPYRVSTAHHPTTVHRIRSNTSRCVPAAAHRSSANIECTHCLIRQPSNRYTQCACNGSPNDNLQRRKKRRSHMNDDQNNTNNMYKKAKINVNRPFSSVNDVPRPVEDYFK